MPLDPPLNPPPQGEMPPSLPSQASATPPLTPPVDSSPLRRVLPGVLSAAAVLGLLLVMLLVVLPRLSQVPRPVRNPVLPSPSAAVLPAAAPVSPLPAVPSAQAPATAQVPLSVTLYSAGSGKHVPVGSPVLVSAYAVLPPAGSATIAIAYSRNGGPRSLLTLAQGSLSTASWTPAAPGRYDFSASASDSRKISVFSRHLIINADASPASAKPRPPPTASSGPSLVQAASVRAIRVRQPMPVPRQSASPPKRLALKHQAARASALKAYHVAAATFVFRPIAETLAGALRRRGFHAFVRVRTQLHHKPTYAVETGDFSRSTDAQKQAGTLKRDGYPASVSQGH